MKVAGFCALAALMAARDGLGVQAAAQRPRWDIGGNDGGESVAGVEKTDWRMHSGGGGMNKESAVKNAPLVFNAVHSAMRQWGSSLRHNGMSFFPASVPAHTLLYHGTGRSSPVNGTDWLAFEIEHAEMFARPMRRPGGPGGGPPGGGPPGRRPPGRGPPGGGPPGGGPPGGGPPGGRPPGGRPPGGGPPGGGPPGGRPPGRQPPPGERPPPDLKIREVEAETRVRGERTDDDEEQHGYLHTYRTTRELTHLIYVDGMSAGKSSMGTLDTQDYILRHNSSSPPSTEPPFSDFARAKDMCALSTEWGLDFAIDGIIRMEAGFELIMCDFASEALEFVSSHKRPDSDSKQGSGATSFFEYMRGVSMRYGGIGGGRVWIAFEAMVSVFFYNVDLQQEKSKEGLPRLLGVDNSIRARIKSDVRGMMVSQHVRELESNAAAGRVQHPLEGNAMSITTTSTWQEIVDMITTRYAPRLQFLVMPETSAYAFTSTLNVLLNVHTDYAAPNATRTPAAIERCTHHYLSALTPSTPSDHLVHAAVANVTGTICDVLFAAWKLVLDVDEDVEAPGRAVRKEEEALRTAKGMVGELVQWLDWSVWRECGACGWDEVCYVAMWPWGSVEDHEKPRCLNASTLAARSGYWDFIFGDGGREGADVGNFS